jgi:hypothetical protein
MFKERIENILEDNNTAQNEFEVLLDKMKLEPQINEINIYESLHGTIDFSVLRKKGFVNIEKICFHREGEIVSVNGLPSTLKQFICNNQLLTELTNLPKDLENLECDFNYLEELDFSTNEKLKKLKCNGNYLEKIENLPETLEEFYCENNKIKRLNLQNLVNLKILHCSNNRTIILEGVSPSIVDLKNENNPLFDGEHFCRNEGELAEKESADLAENNIEYVQGLQQYFKIKNNYEKSLQLKKRIIFKKEENVNKAKRKIERIQPKCIQCERPVGTKFDLKDRHYTAVCGDDKNPCKLNIKIYAGMNDYQNSELLYLLKKDVDDIKNEIIQQKMQTVLNYMSERIASIKFKSLIEKYNLLNKEYLEVLKKYDEMMYGDIRKECIREKQIRVYEILSQIDELVKEGHIDYAVKKQIKDLIPEIDNLRKLKYDIMEMSIFINNSSFGKKEGTETSEEGATGEGDEEGAKKKDNEKKQEYSWLFQSVVAPHKKYMSYGEEPKVVKFVI